jgi:hypothetical protein
VWLFDSDQDPGETMRVVLHITAMFGQVPQVKLLRIRGKETCGGYEVVQLGLDHTHWVSHDSGWLNY